MKKTRSCSVSTSGGISVWGSYLWEEAYIDSDKKYMCNIKETCSFVRQKKSNKTSMYEAGKQIFSSYCKLGYQDPEMHTMGLYTNCKSCTTWDTSPERIVTLGSSIHLFSQFCKGEKFSWLNQVCEILIFRLNLLLKSQAAYINQTKLNHVWLHNLKHQAYDWVNTPVFPVVC